MPTTDSKAIRQTLADRAHGTGRERELAFDPNTGQLIVVRQGEGRPSPDAAIATSIAEEGFFTR